MSYDAHDRLVAPARPTRAPWRLVAGLALGALLYVVLSQMIYSTVAGMMGAERYADFATRAGSEGTPAAVVLQLFTFAALVLALAVALRLLHHRGLMSLLGPLPDTLRTARGVLVAVALFTALLSVLPPWGGAPLPLEANMPLPDWAALLPLGLAGLVLQVSAEELVFRGYIQSQIAARFSRPAIWMGVPALVFAAGHYSPAMHGDDAIYMAAWAGLFSLAASDLTARTGTLGPAIALHFVNNVSALLLVALPGPMSGLALYVVETGSTDMPGLRTLLLIDSMVLLNSWLVARLALRV
jgi:membrane protease YdiL (CAAX protease family)